VCAAAPGSTLIVDANEAWQQADLERYLEACAEVGVALVEQPLPAAKDAILAKIQHIVPIAPTKAFMIAPGSKPCVNATTQSMSNSTKPVA